MTMDVIQRIQSGYMYFYHSDEKSSREYRAGESYCQFAKN